MRPLEELRRVVRRGRSAYRRVRSSAGARRRTFADIFRTNAWGDAESVSGAGSATDQTEALRDELPGLLRSLAVRTLVDAPCGDLNWIRRTDVAFLERYVGADIVPELVERLRAAPPWPGAEFLVADVTTDVLPRADAILCRDCLVHLADHEVTRALDRFRASGSTYLVTTTFSNPQNHDIPTGRWRPINLRIPPFSLGEPLALLDERCTEGEGAFRDKALGVWRLQP